MAITLTERAVAEALRIMKEQKLEEGVMVRVGVLGGGCSGFQYRFEFDRNYDPEKDHLYEQHGKLKVVVDKKSELFLDGLTIDFHEGLDRRGFSFHNPNAVRTCGCGSSFQV